MQPANREKAKKINEYINKLVDKRVTEILTECLPGIISEIMSSNSYKPVEQSQPPATINELRQQINRESGTNDNSQNVPARQVFNTPNAALNEVLNSTRISNRFQVDPTCNSSPVQFDQMENSFDKTIVMNTSHISPTVSPVVHNSQPIPQGPSNNPVAVMQNLHKMDFRGTLKKMKNASEKLQPVQIVNNQPIS